MSSLRLEEKEQAKPQQHWLVERLFMSQIHCCVNTGLVAYNRKG